MLKTVTCGRGLLLRTARQKHIVVGEPGDGPHVDVVATPLRGHRVSADPAKDEPGEYALSGKTLAGDLFLSLLVCGAIG
ncbi:MAG: hypothetical protein ACRD6W_16165 [Nitrososphaerales archaeon]